MAIDKSEPRSGLILKIGVLAVATLVAVHASLVAYFDHIAQAEEHRKFGDVKPEALLSVRASEKERLSSGPVPIEKAMRELATRGRTASPEIVPSASKDLAPLQGWSKMPAEVPPAMTAPREASPAPGAQPVGDASPMMAPPGRPARPTQNPKQP
jgi:hypothetical protein